MNWWILSSNPEETQLQEVTLCNIIKVVSAPDLWKFIDTGNDSNWWDHMVRRNVWTSLPVFQPEKFVAVFLTANTRIFYLIPFKSIHWNATEKIWMVVSISRCSMKGGHERSSDTPGYSPSLLTLTRMCWCPATRSPHTNCHEQNESLYRNSLSHTGTSKQYI